jgi:hypothetical protein
MTGTLLYAFLIQCAAVAVWGLLRKDRIHQYPFLASLAFGLWAWPQFYGIWRTESVEEAWLNRAIVMSMLCLGAAFLGFLQKSHAAPRAPWQLNRRRLWQAGLVLAGVGIVAFVFMLRLPDEAKMGVGASGTAGVFVIYNFFTQATTFAFGVLLLCALERPTISSSLIAVVPALIPLYSAVFYARRTEAFQLVFITATLFWFVRRKAAPRWTAVMLIIGMTLFVYNVGFLRPLMNAYDPLQRTKERADNPAELEMMQSVQDTLREGGWEMNNAIRDMAATVELDAYDFGLYHWNRVVFNYVPTAVIPREVKDTLMIPWANAAYGAAAKEAFGYENNPGSAHGGVTDCFTSFWYFGCVKFFAIGFVLRILYDRAMRGSTIARLTYGLFTVYGCVCIALGTDWFVSPWIHFGIFMGPILAYSYATRRGRQSRAQKRKPSARSGVGAVASANNPDELSPKVATDHQR